jgi:hypothetical protein
MHADATAHGGEGIPLPDDVHGLLVPPARYGRHVVGDVNAGWTGMLARGDDHGVTGGTLATVIQDVLLILFEEILKGGEDGLRSIS